MPRRAILDLAAGSNALVALCLLADEGHFRVAEMSRISGVSRRSIERHITRTCGQTPCGWLNEQRLLAAPGLLLEETSFKGVAVRLGFKQYSHFSREFKKAFHISPTEFLINRVQNGVQN